MNSSSVRVADREQSSNRQQAIEIIAGGQQASGSGAVSNLETMSDLHKLVVSRSPVVGVFIWVPEGYT